MQMRRLGGSKLDVSVLGLGCNNFGWFTDEAQSLRVIAAALDVGITLFDTANNYGMPAGESERILAKGLGRRRPHVTVATKFADVVDDAGLERGAHPLYIRKAVEQSLRNLDTDYIDLYQLHYPDPDVPWDETLGALDELVRSGKVRAIGCANMTGPQLVAALDISARRGMSSFCSCQSEYSLVARDAEADLLPQVACHGLGFLPYFPLANGLLTGKYRGAAAADGRLHTIRQIPFFAKFLTEQRFAAVDRLAEIAARHDTTLLEAALGWLLAQAPVTSVIAGATSASQVEANVAASQKRLDAALLASLGDVSAPASAHAASNMHPKVGSS